MKQFTICANVANNLLNLLQGYTKSIRLLLVMFLTLTVSANAWGATYTKVITAPSDWSGEYLIVYETGKVAFNGALTTLDATSNTVSVEIENNSITSTENSITGATFTIAKSGSNYTIKSASGYYIGQTSNANGLQSSNTSTTYSHTISLSNDGTVNLVSGGAYLRYNAASNQYRFRYYKSSSYTGQKAICLYKKEESAKTTTITIDPNTSNHGTGNNVSVTATYGQALPLFTACTPATGYELAGYYTSATGGTKLIGINGKLVASVSGYTDANAKWINESTSLTLYAQYSAKNYTVTYDSNSGITTCTGGTYTYNTSFTICSDNPTRTGYSFTGWSDGSNTYKPGANYTMHAKNVTFTAQWQILSYTVTWVVDGDETEVDVNYNSKPTGAPTIDPNSLPCDGADKFVGWTTGEYKGDTAPGTLYPTANDIPAITEDKTFYAVFADYAN